MNINEKINELYGSVDQMIKETNTTLSRSYIYQICNGNKSNITIEVAKELMKLLKLNSIDEVLELLHEPKKI